MSQVLGRFSSFMSGLGKERKGTERGRERQMRDRKLLAGVSRVLRPSGSLASGF